MLKYPVIKHFFVLILRAPTDCAQYFTGQQGSFQSFNYVSGGLWQQGQNHNICFRQEEGLKTDIQRKPQYNLKFTSLFRILWY